MDAPDLFTFHGAENPSIMLYINNALSGPHLSQFAPT